MLTEVFCKHTRASRKDDLVGMEGVHGWDTLARCLGARRRPLAEHQNRDIGERVRIVEP
jgi:hypothetical protein